MEGNIKFYLPVELITKILSYLDFFKDYMKIKPFLVDKLFNEACSNFLYFEYLRTERKRNPKISEGKKSSNSQDQGNDAQEVIDSDEMTKRFDASFDYLKELKEILVFDNFQTTEMYKNKPYNMSLWDTSGQEDYDRLRPMSYPDTNIIFCVFSLVEPKSLLSVKEKWVPEVNEFLKPSVPIILVGTELEMREEAERENRDFVARSEGRKMAKKIGAAAYHECSAKTGDGLREVFREAVRLVLYPPPPRKKTLRKKKKKKGGKRSSGCLTM